MGTSNIQHSTLNVQSGEQGKPAWKIERRQWGKEPSFGCTGDVLALGKWAVVGRTGAFFVIGPDGWQRPQQFTIESEAVAWVERQ